VAFSGFLPFPTAAVEDARRFGFDKHTAGEVVAQRLAGAKGTDPHAALTSQLVSRRDLLEQAVLACIGQALAAGHVNQQ